MLVKCTILRNLEVRKSPEEVWSRGCLMTTQFGKTPVIPYQTSHKFDGLFVTMLCRNSLKSKGNKKFDECANVCISRLNFD